MKHFAASLMCGDPLYVAEELRKLEEAGCDLLHLDVMDGIYVNNLALGPEWIEAVKNFTSIPIDIHLACVDPIKYIDMFASTKPDYLSFHVEVVDDVKKVIQHIKTYGIKPSIALNPETDIEAIIPYLEEVDMVLMMTVNPGFSGQKFNEEVIPKIKKLKAVLENRKHQPLIEVDGNIHSGTIALMEDIQPDVYVLGTSALFHNKDQSSYTERLEFLKRFIDSLEKEKSSLKSIT
ncbi:ribulose-phosphate 3-epimerase [Alkalibacterium putridalgicola]|uniref:ribulose-phosphate 3-epimerase n=1 Tax=Alkalibacterium putridalgicola TaxID=426703 RepID=UPI0034CFAD5F